MSLQGNAPLSKTKAEYMALTYIAKEALLLRDLFSGFGLEQKSFNIYCDNQGAIYLALNPIYHEQT